MANDKDNDIEKTEIWDAAEHRYWDNLKKLEILFEAQ